MRCADVLEERLDNILQQYEAGDVTELVLIYYVADEFMFRSKRFIRSITVNYLSSLKGDRRFIGWYEYKGNYIKITRCSRCNALNRFNTDVLSSFDAGVDVRLRVVG